MRTKLTPAFVQQATAALGAERTVFWDEGLPGFGLVVTGAGAKSFVCQYRAGRRSRRLTFKRGLTLDKARKEAKAVLGVVAKGGDPLAERRKEEAASENTFKSLAEDYLNKEAGLRSIDQRRACFERLVYPKFGSRQIDTIRRSEVVRLLDRIEEERGPVMADQVLAYLRRLFTWHAGRSDDFRSPIVRGMSRTKPSQRRRQRILSDEELGAVWGAAKASEGPFGHWVRFILLTAVRRNEAAKMMRSEIDGTVWTIPGKRHKSKSDFLLPLSTAALALLADVPVIGRRHDGHIFTTDGKRAIGGFSKAKREFDDKVLAYRRKQDPEAKPMPRWTIHDLRRTARSLMSRAAVNPDHAERAIGHVIPGIRGTYDLYEFREEKRYTFEALAAQIERIVNPQDNVVPLHVGA
jgi:integrase